MFVRGNIDGENSRPDSAFAKFDKLGGGRGMRLLTDMGYVEGERLGVDSQGRVNPIDVVKRPKNMGLGY